MEFKSKSKSLGVAILAEWCEKLRFQAKQYVKLELLDDNTGFNVRRISFQ